MKIKMLNKAFGYDQDERGVVLDGKWYEKGEEYELSESLGDCFVSMKNAAMIGELIVKESIEKAPQIELEESIEKAHEEMVQDAKKQNEKVSKKTKKKITRK